MPEIYRKSSMEKLSTLDQLDKAVVITSPSTWLALVGAAGIIVSVILWSIFGRIPENISARGILLDRGGVHTVYSEVAGTVAEVLYETGDHVSKGDVILRMTGKELEKNEGEIKSNYDGVITEYSVVEGQVIAAGENVARISRKSLDSTVAVCYIPAEEGRKIDVGMNASIYPSTANKQEYGHMKGTVEYVDEFVTSRVEILQQVGLPSLAETFLSDGPVVEVRFALEKDDTTESGYWWSSKKGAEIKLANGTLVSADIVIKEAAPITYVLPYLADSASSGD